MNSVLPVQRRVCVVQSTISPYYRTSLCFSMFPIVQVYMPPYHFVFPSTGPLVEWPLAALHLSSLTIYVPCFGHNFQAFPLMSCSTKDDSLCNLYWSYVCGVFHFFPKTQDSLDIVFLWLTVRYSSQEQSEEPFLSPCWCHISDFFLNTVLMVFRF